MEEKNVLLPEEVEAMINAAQEVDSNVLSTGEGSLDEESKINTNALNSILEATRNLIETKLTAIFRTKVGVENKPIVITQLEEIEKQASKDDMYSSFNILPSNLSTVICAEHAFLDDVINLLFGGSVDDISSADVPLGKIGKITAQKLTCMFVECLSETCQEYDSFTIEHYKTSGNFSSINTLPDDQDIYSINFTASYDNHESNFTLYIAEQFFINIIPVSNSSSKHREKDFWRKAIKGEVVDSYVNVTSVLTDVKVKMKDLKNLKEGDELEISDPTLVYVCLNKFKLFRGLAGQSNDKVVIKIVSQI